MPETTTVEVTFVLAVDCYETRKFVATSTTTGSAPHTANNVVSAVRQDTIRGINALRTAEQPPVVDATRRAAVTARVIIGGDRPFQVDLDTTTTGSVFAAAEALVVAAGRDLHDWLCQLTLAASRP